MKRLLRLFWGAIPFLFLSCEYGPDGSYFVDVNPTPNTAFAIDLDQPGDTLYVRGTVDLKYTIKTPGKKIHEYRWLLNNQVITQHYEPSKSITLSTERLADTTHVLTLKVRTTTGTGSLSDKSGVEQLEAYRTWVLITDNAPPSTVSITKVFEDEGTLRVTWEKYKRRYLKNIYLYRINTYGYADKVIRLSPDATSGTDTEYLGGPVKYMLAFEDDRGKFAYSERVAFSSPLPTYKSHYYENTNDLVVAISPGKFYKNFGKRTFGLSAYDFYKTVETTAVSDSVVTFRDLPFGTGFRFSLNTIPKETENANASTVRYTETIPGFGAENSFEPFTFTAYVPALNMFYHRHNLTLKNIDAATMQVKHSKYYNSGAMAISQNGRYLYVFTHTYQDQILQLDPITLEVVNTFYIRQMIPGASFTNMDLSVSNTNRLLVSFFRYNAPTQSYLLNMDEAKVELTNVGTSMPQLSSISPGGEMVTAAGYVYRKSPSGEWVARQNPNPLTNLLRYHPSQPLYTYVTNSVLRFYSTTDDAEVKSLTLDPGVAFSAIDPATAYVTASDKDFFYIYDIDRNRLLKKIRKINSVSYPVSFYKDRLYAADYYLPITF